MLRNGKTVGYYSSIAGSYGSQVGVQWFGYALFLMTDEALQYLDNANGWEIGLGPSVVVVDAGMAKKHSSTTLTQDDLRRFLADRQAPGGTTLVWFDRVDREFLVAPERLRALGGTWSTARYADGEIDRSPAPIRR